ncbi:MAG TPA: 4-alpha-glucanotransferase [Candidatus Dormibacteraeota bacterium]|nr:4-alpha-glucanotransferase [Candidatus Dormibacteraeota bacterium]
MSDRALRWGVVPRYYSYRGDVIETSPATEEAILAAMGASGERPPSARRHKLPPDSCARPPGRVWGWAVQLYALRSRESWGVGDLADLRRFARWTRGQGGSVILLNPLGAQNPTLPYEPSPYYASTRRFRNTLFLRVEEVDGAENYAAELEPLRAKAQELNHVRLIDYDEVFRIKSKALELIYRAAPEPRGFAGWTSRQGHAVRDFATFNALAEVHGPAWRSWPSSLRHPRHEDVERQRVQLTDRVAFHTWLQFHVDRQLGAAGREIGLITDVPVGFTPDGFDAWRWQDLLAPGMRIGVPPDEFFPDGQDWGLPPFDPWKLRRAHFEPFIEAMRGAAVHATGIRLDHVMGLFRLFWIPAGATAASGAYVRYPASELLALLALESRRAGAFVIGEDLGLVEPSVRSRLRRRGALSYRLLWFEGPTPDLWPRAAVAAVGTHDLPTVAGIWNLSEPDQRQHRLRSRLLGVTHAPDGTSPIDVAVAAYESLARSRTCIVLASLEDALGVEERANVPGTTLEFPNWRLALPTTVEDIEHADGVLRIVEAMKAAGRRHRD